MLDSCNIRLMGTSEECLAVLDKFERAGITILEISRFYPNRGNTKQGRVYVTIRL